MRPAGAARMALLAVLQAGMAGHVDVLAQHAGVPVHQARRTLCNLCREGVASVHGVARSALVRGAGRPPAIYGPTKSDPDVCDALAFARGVWR